MEEVVAIRVTAQNGQQYFFVTWGRVFDTVDPGPLLKAITAAADKFGVRKIRHVEVCQTLQAAASEPYFYEALLSFSGQKIPSGKAYAKWKSARRRQILAGKEIYYLGRSQVS